MHGKNELASILFSALEPKIENASALIDLDIFSADEPNGYAACINPHSFCVALNNKEFMVSLLDSKYILVDGVGFSIYRSMKYGAPKSRQTGNYTIENLLLKLGSRAKVALIGGTNGSVNIVGKKLKSKFKSEIVYCLEPPMMDHFPKKFIQDLICEIKKTDVNIILIGLGAPKQEILSRILSLGVKDRKIYIQGVGAFFDYMSGRVPKPPKFVVWLGIEWLYRLIFSFRRVWRRTFVSAPLFIYYGVRNIILKKA